MGEQNLLNINALKSLLMTDSPSSAEDEIFHFAKSFNNGNSIERDSLGNIFISLSNKKNASVMVAAHCDEIGLQVVRITENGLIRFRPVGGVDVRATAGRQVNIISNGVKVPGVICKPPVHIDSTDNRDKSISFTDMWIDIGCSKQSEAQHFVSVGDIVSFRPNYLLLSNNRVSSKALDNKVGVFIALSAMKRFVEKQISTNVITVLTIQEEVGGKGAAVAANALQPKWGICIDVGIASDCPGVPVDSYGDFYLGKGPGLSFCTDTSSALTRQAATILEKEGIPFQRTIGLSASGGTDTRRMQIAGPGVPCLLINIPIRSMHTPAEVCDLNDVAAAIDAVVALVLGVKI